MKEYSQSKISKKNWDTLEIPCAITSGGVPIAEIFSSRKKLDYIDLMPVTDLRINTVKKRESLQSKINTGLHRLAIYQPVGVACGNKLKEELNLYIKKPQLDGK